MGFAKKKKKQDAIGWLLIFFVIVVAGGALYVMGNLLPSKQRIDENTMCPISGPISKTAIIVDKTDSYNHIQIASLENIFSNIEENIPIGGMILFYVVNKNSYEDIEPFFTACNPGSGDDANSLYENPKLLRDKWLAKFKEPLKEIRAEIIHGGAEKSSPIFEVVQAVSLTGFNHSVKEIPLELHLFSDMLQHTKEWSHYAKGGDDFSKLEASSYFQKIRTDLQGANIFLHYIRRDGAEGLQIRRNTLFWEKYFKLNNAVVQSVDRVDG